MARDTGQDETSAAGGHGQGADPGVEGDEASGDGGAAGDPREGREGEAGKGSGSERPRAGWGAFADIQDAVTDLVDTAIRNVSPAGGRHPRYDLVDLGEAGYVLSFDLPGLEKTDVDVSATQGEVTISGARPRPTLPEGGEVLRSERSYGRFRRSLRVPADVDIGRISARMTNGVLEISLPREQDREARHVEVE